MAVLQSLDELKNWDEYRVFMRKYLKLMAGTEEPFYVSKARIEFDINGKVWRGHGLLLGKRSRMLAQRMRQAGELFLEGTCTSDGKKIELQGLSEKYVKGAGRTLKRLKLGFLIEGAEDDEDGDTEEPAASRADGDEAAGSTAGSTDATSEESGAEEQDEAAQERAWRRVKARAIGRIRTALDEGGPNVRVIRTEAREMQRLEREEDYTGAARALRRVLAAIEGAPAGQGSNSEPDAREGSDSSARASAAEGESAGDGAESSADAPTAQARRAEGDLTLLAQRIEKAVELWSKTERLATRELRKLQRAIQSSGDARGRGVIQGLEAIRTNLERIDDEAREAAEAARGGDRTAFEAARDDFRRKVRQIEGRIQSDPLIEDADANPFVSTNIRGILMTSLGRLKQAI